MGGLWHCFNHITGLIWVNPRRSEIIYDLDHGILSKQTLQGAAWAAGNSIIVIIVIEHRHFKTGKSEHNRDLPDIETFEQSRRKGQSYKKKHSWVWCACSFYLQRFG